MISRLAFAAAAWAASLVPTLAEECTTIDYRNTAGLVRWANLKVSDSVEGGCWTNASSIESKLRLMFEQSDVPLIADVKTSSPFAVAVVASAYGARRSGTCVVSASFDVMGWAYAVLGDTDPMEERFVAPLLASFHGRDYVAVSSSNTNGLLTEFFEEQAATFLADVLAGRRDPDIERFEVPLEL